MACFLCFFCFFLACFLCFLGAGLAAGASAAGAGAGAGCAMTGMAKAATSTAASSLLIFIVFLYLSVLCASTSPPACSLAPALCILNANFLRHVDNNCRLPSSCSPRVQIIASARRFSPPVRASFPVHFQTAR
ncbi:hypothetical protein Hsero_3615 [Herbaspirillum seropedicae SmR1]|uniref:Transmembrane protein n=1 Tax=Herbaspirillum seropedicae (strain SmR1) TaxID=757424 RepID=D8IQI1_HERSS|nr:hypothetical protein Hsero_3615 [Herbaspirillum seropedicae SmR1]